MSGDDKWDADFQQSTLSMGLVSQQWEGEDEDDIKDCWDDPEEEENEAKEAEAAALKAKLEKEQKDKKKKLQEAKSLKEEKRLEDMTPEERFAEKLKRQKLQEESDLQLAKEMIGDLGFGDDTRKEDSDKSDDEDTTRSESRKAVNSSQSTKNSVARVKDDSDPFVLRISDTSVTKSLKTKKDFENYKDEIVSHLSGASRNEHFTEFVNKMVHTFCGYLTTADVKNLHTSIGSLHAEKLKADQGKSKKKVKPTIKKAHDADVYDNYYEEEDIYNDFM
ncbi:eukaryotic translation initiation factor 3 subunit J [Nilaparvata lugens]|uniref:eukaryotic translation initiation factor 3 subunit J n=1 Tax=Nilaparvata lugens TaxID=108931 RepID=UPI000B98D8F3|nr:eukaryotic translation initiation factor 3 subunit J [Nilaparvata lugens]